MVLIIEKCLTVSYRQDIIQRWFSSSLTTYLYSKNESDAHSNIYIYEK